MKKSIIFKSEYADFMRGEIFSPLKTQNYTVLQVADSYYLSDFEIPPHRQICDIEITFTVFGDISSLTDGVLERSGRGEAHVTFLGEEHSLRSEHSARFQTLAVSVDSSSMTYPLFLAIKERCRGGARSRVAKIGSLMTELVSEFMSSGEHRDLLADALITAILTALAREAEPRKYAPRENALPEILNYIDKNFLEIGSLSELSAHFSYSYAYICRLFRASGGVSPHDYLAAKKMEYARSLLSSGATVTEAAEILGYANPFNFSRAYKKHFGKSPTKK